MNSKNIPAPPPGDLGDIPPPPGYPKAYVPSLVKELIVEKDIEVEEVVADDGGGFDQLAKKETLGGWRNKVAAPKPNGGLFADDDDSGRGMPPAPPSHARPSQPGLFSTSALNQGNEPAENKAGGGLFDDEDENPLV